MNTPPLSWVGKVNETDDIQMYLPLMVSVRPLLEMLAFEFDDSNIEHGMVVAEILKDILVDDNQLSNSRAEKALELVLSSSSLERFRNSTILHECRIALADIVAELIPAGCTDRTFPYYYPHGDMFILYIPTDPKSITDKTLKSKLVPYMALRCLDY